MPTIPGFGRLVWAKSRRPCFSCQNMTWFDYLNPNGQKTPCCKKCYDRIFKFVSEERDRNIHRRRSIAFYIIWGLGLVMMLIALYLLLRRP